MRVKNSFGTLDPTSVSPAELKPKDIAGFKVVAVMGEAGDWAAYRGPTQWTDEEVARQGDKIDANTANGLFWAFRTFPYRE